MTAAPATPAAVSNAERAMVYKPLAERDEITLTIASVMNTLAVRTKSGALPTVPDVVKFMMLCKSRGLNPFVGDAYLVGYDSQQDGPTFQLITAIQALRKRAELNPNFDGCARGVIVARGDDVIEREGSMTYPGETLVGGWASCQRKDYSIPFRETVKLATYSTGRSRWAKDKEGMIIKVAEAAALRRAFPSDVGGLYVAEEFDAEERTTVKSNVSERLADLRKRPEPGATPTPPVETVVAGASARPTEPEGAGEYDDRADGGPDPECAEAETLAGNQAFSDLRDMLTRAMRIQDVEAVRSVAMAKKNLLTQAQWNQLAMADADQVALIQGAEEAERAGK